MLTRRQWRRNRKNIIFGILMVGSLAVNHQSIGQNMESMRSLRQELEIQQNNQTRLELNEEAIAAMAKIASSRLTRGCVPVVDPRYKEIKGYRYFNLVPLQKEKPVRDRTNKSFLVAGTCVVGANGETAILEENEEGIPVARNIAAGGSKELVDRNIKRLAGARAKVFWNSPIN
jgi:hypothetical protein